MPTRRVSASPTPSGSESSEGEQDFLDSLTRKQVLEITEAFDAGAAELSLAGKTTLPASNKRRRVEFTSNKSKGKGKAREEPPAPGGFLLEDDDDMAADNMGGGGFMPEGDEAAPGGGFMPEDSIYSSYGGEGFLPEGSSSRQSQPSATGADHAHKPKSVLLDRIPNVLVQLGLDGDDSSILSIFENASFSDPENDGLQAVKRKNFLKVAALLVTQRDQERDEERTYQNANRRKQGKTSTLVSSGGGKGRAINIDADEVQDADKHDDSDPLILSSSDEDDEDDAFNRDNEDSDPWADEDEIEGAFTGGRDTSPPRSRRTTRSRAKSGHATSSPAESLASDDDQHARKNRRIKDKNKAKSEDDSKAGKYRLSSRQKDECNRMFQQFFPNSDQSKNRAITMSEIRYVATLLNEKISDEDVSPMYLNIRRCLSAYSVSCFAGY